MTGRRVGVGDLVAIPAGPNREIAGHVLFCSAYFDKVVLLALYPVDAHRDAATILEARKQRRLVFTGRQGIVAGHWRRIGVLLPSDEPAVVRFIAGGEVWENDTPVRAATDADMGSLPKLLVKGAGLVEKVAQSLIE